MSELMGEHSGELGERESCDQWQPDAEGQPTVLSRDETEVSSRRRIGLEVDLDVRRYRSANSMTESLYELEQKRLVFTFQAPERWWGGWARKNRFGHEENELLKDSQIVEDAEERRYIDDSRQGLEGEDEPQRFRYKKLTR